MINKNHLPSIFTFVNASPLSRIPTRPLQLQRARNDNITVCHSEPATPYSNKTDAAAKGEESSDAQSFILSHILFVAGSFSFVIPSPQPCIATVPMPSQRARNLASHRASHFRISCSSLDPSALRVYKQTLQSIASRLRMTILERGI